MIDEAHIQQCQASSIDKEKNMDIERINQYINDLYATKTNLNKTKYREDTELKDFIPTVDTEVARFLQLVIHLTGARNILEIGTSIGYSTTSMAKEIINNNGKITTIEYDEIVAKQALSNFKREHVDSVITLKNGDARKILPLLSESYDLIFQDVDKSLYPVLYEDCIRLLKPKGILVADDTLFPVVDLGERWKYLIPYIEQFNDLVVHDDRVSSTILPIGDGVTIAIKK